MRERWRQRQRGLPLPLPLPIADKVLPFRPPRAGEPTHPQWATRRRVSRRGWTTGRWRGQPRRGSAWPWPRRRTAVRVQATDSPHVRLDVYFVLALLGHWEIDESAAEYGPHHYLGGWSC